MARRPLFIVWDAFAIGNGYSGIAQHARLLNRDLAKIGVFPLLLNPETSAHNSSSQANYACLFRPNRRHSLFATNKVFRAHGMAFDEAWLAELADKSLGFQATKIIHGLSNYNIPLDRKRSFAKRVVTVHDLIPLLAKGKVSKPLSLQMSYLMPKAIQAADQVIAVSHWTASTLLDLFPEVSSRLVIIPNGFELDKKGVNRTDVSRETLTQGHHFLSVSRFEIYKRFDRMVEVLNLAPEHVKLTVVTDSRGATYFREHAQNLLKTSRLELKTRVTEEELVQLYRSVDALLHFSEFEGFCLPAAEAISKGLPVIFQKGSGIDEVVGPCGVGMDRSASNQDWAELLASEDWRIAKTLVKDWLNAQIPWSQVARQTLAVYTRL